MVAVQSYSTNASTFVKHKKCMTLGRVINNGFQLLLAAMKWFSQTLPLTFCNQGTANITFSRCRVREVSGTGQLAIRNFHIHETLNREKKIMQSAITVHHSNSAIFSTSKHSPVYDLLLTESWHQ